MSMRFFEIVEAGIRIQNPFSEEKLMLVGEICHKLGYLQPGVRLLDLACGQGEMLSRWARLYGITGTGVDISEAFLETARQRAEELGVTSQVEFVKGDAAQYPQDSHAYDVVSCIGATDIGGGTNGFKNMPTMPTLPNSSRRLRTGSVLTWHIAAILGGECSCCA